jgi:hypothetical protein
MPVFRETKEWADCTVIEDRQTMDRVDIVNNLIETGRNETFENRESTSLLRMK